MNEVLIFTREQTYIWYFGAIILATFFASLAERFAITRNGQKKVNKLFWIISFLCLFIPLGFRGYGIDHESYTILYNQINSPNFSYNGFPEPLFTILNCIVGSIFGDFQYIYIISAFISLLFMYIGFSNRINKSNLAICVWMLSISLYFYMYGLVRMFIAIGIIIYAHQFIDKKEMFKYFFWVLIAGLFHYSAFIIFPLYFLLVKKNKKEYTSRNHFINAMLSIFVIPVVFIISSQIFILVFSKFTWFSRYTNYFQVNFNISMLKNFIWILPLLVIVLFMGKRISQKMEDGHTLLRMFWILVSFSVTSSIFPVMRLTFYIYYVGFYLYSGIPNLGFNRHEKLIILYIISCVMLIIGIVYINTVFFHSIYIDPFLIPYHFYIP